ncbi:hypothetical protein QBC39DRAFT_366742 [Podospora conica]|nr:hypothetical protein QBC39DRAFT_366742 [Schizothecium conicum]
MTTTPLRPPGRDHIPLYPRYFLPLRLLQLLLALVVLGFGAYGVATIAIPGNIFIVVAAIFNITASTYHVLSLSESPRTSLSRFRVKGFPRIYNIYAVLALDVFLVCVWLGAAVTLTVELVVIHALTRRYGRFPYGEGDGWVAVGGAGAGGGGVEG